MVNIKTILIANRGEIAVRVIRTAKGLGYRTIAVYSDADAEAAHVRLADDAVRIGPAPVAESYLNMDALLDAARRSGADAIHPGYGFLSENAAFAQACENAGLVFIGPSPEAIRVMGNKAEAKRRMIAAGVPCVPGYEGHDQSDGTFLAAAETIGFPLMVKAAAGGGGRGMRLVHRAEDLSQALALARSEAENAFGSGELILEKAILRPRHVEIQVLGDAHGHIIHMGERDCSVQRRHQKVIEEAPCPVMTPELRARMGAAAVEAARSIAYRGAGTVEFLLADDGAFYFLEMNTRLQVEHPVTELITGLDLVALQIQVAEGRPLGLAQEDISLFGHAIEVRLYAEDPTEGFLPVTGTVDLWHAAAGDGIRIDTGLLSGQEISPFYDPMIAKLMAHGPTRETARRRLIEALESTALFGLRTNKSFLLDCLKAEDFARGAATTAFIAETFGDTIAAQAPSVTHAAMAAVLQFVREQADSLAKSVGVSTALLDWCSAGRVFARYHYQVEGEDFDLAVSPIAPRHYRVDGAGGNLEVTLQSFAAPAAVLNVDGRRFEVLFHHRAGDGCSLQSEGHAWHFRNQLAFAGMAEEMTAGGRVVAPMHGKLLTVFVAPGQAIAKGERLAVLEAMKMQHEILAEVDGTVREVFAQAGTQVAADDVLIDIEEMEIAETA